MTQTFGGGVQAQIKVIAEEARRAIEAWITRDEDLCAVASGYLHSQIVAAGLHARVMRGCLVCDHPHPSLRGPFFDAGRPPGHIVRASHVWVEVDDLLVDITASQFNDQLDAGFEPVTIGRIDDMPRHTRGVEVEPFVPHEAED